MTNAPEWLGKRKRKPGAMSYMAKPIGWPIGKSERRDYLGTWFFVAAQIAATKTDFAVLLSLRQWTDIRTGICTATNEQLAQWGGGLSPTHASRSISAFARAGIVTVETGCREDEDGRQRKTRTLRLSYPEPFPAGLTLIPDANHLATRAQDEGGPETGIHLAPRAQATPTRAQVYDRARVLR